MLLWWYHALWGSLQPFRQWTILEYELQGNTVHFVSHAQVIASVSRLSFVVVAACCVFPRYLNKGRKRATVMWAERCELETQRKRFMSILFFPSEHTCGIGCYFYGPVWVKVFFFFSWILREDAPFGSTSVSGGRSEVMVSHTNSIPVFQMEDGYPARVCLSTHSISAECRAASMNVS